MSKTFFTSDTHFQHVKIRIYSNRPYESVEQMDEDLIRRWNETVSPDDTVWHLGDFALGNQRNIPSIVSRLNGTIHLCWGNHDNRELIEDAGWFASTQDVAMIRLGEDRVFLSHYGHRVWNGSHKGNFHLYGHSHGGLPPIARSLDVGVDEFDYRPVTLDQVKVRLAELNLLDLVTGHHHR